LEDWEEKFERRIPQPCAALGVVSKLPAAFPSTKLNRSFRVYHISCYWMNIQVDPTSSNLASAMLNSKIGPRAFVGYGAKTFHASPPNHVTRSPGKLWRVKWKRKSKIHRNKSWKNMFRQNPLKFIRNSGEIENKINTFLKFQDGANDKSLVELV